MATLDTLQKRKEEVDKIVNDITLKSKVIEERIVQASTFLNSVKTTDKEFHNLVQELQQIHQSAKENVDNFKIEKSKINNLYSDIRKFYDSKYLPLAEKIGDPETGFVAKIKQVNTTSKNIISISNSCKAQFEKIKNFADRYTKALKTLESLDKSIRKIYTNIESVNFKSNDFLKNIQETKKSSDLFAREISTLKQNSVKYEKEIESLLKKSEEDYDDIASNKVKSEETLQEIYNIYEIAADTGRSGEFDKRRKAVTIDLKKWENHVRYSTIGLFGVIIGLFIWQLYLSNWDLKELTADLSFYLRFIITSPIIYYVTFASVQYGKAKKLVDIYSYKTTMAMSIKSHLELLTTNESLKKYDKDILQFTLEAFGKIYKEPYDNEDLKMQLKMSGIELGFEKTKFKELKEILTKIERGVKENIE